MIVTCTIYCIEQFNWSGEKNQLKKDSLTMLTWNERKHSRCYQLLSYRVRPVLLWEYLLEML